MKAFVINLAGSQDRRVHMEAQLQREGLDYKFLPATDVALPGSRRSRATGRPGPCGPRTALAPAEAGRLLPQSGIKSLITSVAWELDAGKAPEWASTPRDQTDRETVTERAGSGRTLSVTALAAHPAQVSPDRLSQPRDPWLWWKPHLTH